MGPVVDRKALWSSTIGRPPPRRIALRRYARDELFEHHLLFGQIELHDHPWANGRQITMIRCEARL